MLHFVF